MKKKSNRNLCAAAKRNPDKTGEWLNCTRAPNHKGMHRDDFGTEWPTKARAAKKLSKRPRCGAKQPGFPGSCWLAPGHAGNHHSRTADWPQMVPCQAFAPALLQQSQGIGLRCTDEKGHSGQHSAKGRNETVYWGTCGAVDTEHGWLCELAPGHAGEHQCGEFKWPHSYGEAAPPTADKPACGSDGCILPSGHEGRHEDKTSFWPRKNTDACAPEPANASPKCDSQNPNWPWLCVLPPGHEGMHKDRNGFMWVRYGTDTCAPEANPQRYCRKPVAVTRGIYGHHDVQCLLPAAHEGACSAIPSKPEQPNSLTQKLVLHLDSGEAELSEWDAKKLWTHLCAMFGNPPDVMVMEPSGILRPFGKVAPTNPESYTVSGPVRFGPGTVTVTGNDGKSFTLTNAVVTHHFYPSKKP